MVCAGENNLGMNISGNVFNRLGRGDNMKETLNRNTSSHDDLGESSHARRGVRGLSLGLGRRMVVKRQNWVVRYLSFFIEIRDTQSAHTKWVPLIEVPESVKD